VAEQVPQRNLALGVLFKDGVDRKPGEIRGDGFVQVEQTVLNGEQNPCSRKGFRNRLYGKDCVGIDQQGAIVIWAAKPFDP
jgi:hypothetical protein